MLPTLPPPGPLLERPARLVTMRASRPSLIDLRFKGDPWIVADGARGSVRLGDYPLAQVVVSPLDLPSLNSTLWQIRLGQARRNYPRRSRKG